MAAIVIAAIIVFIAGVSAGIIAIVSAGIHREERDLAKPEFNADPPGSGPDDPVHARWLTGLHVLNRDAADRRDEMFV